MRIVQSQFEMGLVCIQDRKEAELNLEEKRSVTGLLVSQSSNVNQNDLYGTILERAKKLLGEDGPQEHSAYLNT